MKNWLTLLAAVPLAFLLGDQLLARTTAEPDRLSADISLRHGLGAATGDGVHWAPEQRYRLTRERTARGWQTTIAVAAGDTGTRAGVGNVVGVVDSGDDQPLQFIDTKGRRIPRPGRAEVDALLGRASTPTADGLGTVTPARPRNTGTDWVAALISSAADREKRGRALRLALGQPRGRVRGFDQYVVREGEKQREVLVDAVQAVPVEVNVGAGTTLESHTVLSYQSDVQGNLFRTGMRTERVAGDAGGRRSVVDVRFTNIRLPKGGLR